MIPEELREYLLPSVLPSTPVGVRVQATLSIKFKCKFKDSVRTFRMELRDKALKCFLIPPPNFFLKLQVFFLSPPTLSNGNITWNDSYKP